MACLKMVASCCKASICLSPIWENGAAGVRFWRALMSSVAATVAFSADDRNDILELCEKNSTVSDWVTAFVLSM